MAVRSRSVGSWPGAFRLAALSANRVVSVDALLEDLWHDDAKDIGPPALRVHVSRLRSLLSPDQGVLVTKTPGYLLAVAPDDVDAVRCEELVAAAHASAAGGDHGRAAEQFRAAVSLFTGPPLHGLTQPYFVGAIAHLDGLRNSPWRDGCMPTSHAGATGSWCPSWKR